MQLGPLSAIKHFTRMKNIVISISTVFMSMNYAFSQSICDSIEFYSDTIYVNQSTDDSIRIRFDFNLAAGTVAYPSYFVSLNDTSNVVFHQVFFGTFLGQQDSIDFEIVYKNASIPQGYSVTGTFDVFDPNSSPQLICQFPFVIIFNTSLDVENQVKEISIELFPNPFQDAVTIEINNPNIKELFISDLFGKIIMDLEIAEHQKINMANFQSGTYFLTAIDNRGQSVCKKLIKCP